MKDGICPKCGSQEIYLQKDNHYLSVGFLKLPAILTDFICVTCGYHESYLLEENRRKRIRQSWSPFQKLKRKNDE